MESNLILNNMEDRIVFGKAVMSYDKEENESIYLFDQAGNEIVHSGEAAEGDIKKITHDVKNWNSGSDYARDKTHLQEMSGSGTGAGRRVSEYVCIYSANGC